MRKRTLFSVLSLACLWLGQQSAVRADDGCEAFRLTTTVDVAPTGPGEFSLVGAGEGTIGEVTQTGVIEFRLFGHAVHFRSLTVISTTDGDHIYTAEAGIATEQGTVGSYRILGGTGAWEGASGKGAFQVEINADRTQTATYTGVICR